MKDLATQHTILAIDDDVDILEVLTLILEGEGYHVLTDATGEYFNQSGAVIPDLILLDLLISGSSGRHVCEQLKHDKQTKHIPIILVSAHTPKEVEMAQRECGADGYITKPFDIDHLLATVRSFLMPG